MKNVGYSMSAFLYIFLLNAFHAPAQAAEFREEIAALIGVNQDDIDYLPGGPEQSGFFLGQGKLNILYPDQRVQMNIQGEFFYTPNGRRWLMLYSEAKKNLFNEDDAGGGLELVAAVDLGQDIHSDLGTFLRPGALIHAYVGQDSGTQMGIEVGPEITVSFAGDQTRAIAGLHLNLKLMGGSMQGDSLLYGGIIADMHTSRLCSDGTVSFEQASFRYGPDHCTNRAWSPMSLESEQLKVSAVAGVNIPNTAVTVGAEVSALRSAQVLDVYGGVSTKIRFGKKNKKK